MKNSKRRSPLSTRCISIKTGIHSRSLNNVKRFSVSLYLLDESRDIEGLNLISKNVRRISSPYEDHEYIYDRLDIFKNPYQTLIMPKSLKSMRLENIKYAVKG